MIDKSKRIVRELVPLEQVPMLQGKQIQFQSIAEMVATRAREIPDTPLVYYYDAVITYAQVNARANRVANFLKSKGVVKGDIVSTMILNSPEDLLHHVRHPEAGAWPGAINYMLKGPEIAYVLDDSKPKVVFVGSEYMTDFAAGLALASHQPIVVEVVTGWRTPPGSRVLLGEILSAYPSDECLVPQAPDDPFHAALLLGHHRHAQGHTALPPQRDVHMQDARCWASTSPGT
jgi:long-chain acyl-CoA synthetase